MRARIVEAENYGNENANISPLRVISDATALGGKCLGTGPNSSLASNYSFEKTYGFQRISMSSKYDGLRSPAKYFLNYTERQAKQVSIWGRLKGIQRVGDSFWLSHNFDHYKVPRGTDFVTMHPWHFPASSSPSAWAWHKWGQSDSLHPREDHVLMLGHRETNSQIDQLYISSSNILNGGFELDGLNTQDTTNWKSSFDVGADYVSASAAHAYEGSSRLVHRKSVPYRVITHTKVRGLEPGYYEVSAQARSTGRNFAWKVMSAKGVGGNASRVSIPESSVYQPLVLADVRVSDNGAMQIAFSSKNNKGGERVDIDDVVLKRMPAATVYNGGFEVDQRDMSTPTGWVTYANQASDPLFNSDADNVVGYHADAGMYNLTHRHKNPYRVITATTVRGLNTNRKYDVEARVRSNGNSFKWKVMYARGASYGNVSVPSNTGSAYKTIQIKNLTVKDDGTMQVGFSTKNTRGRQSVCIDSVKIYPSGSTR